MTRETFLRLLNDVYAPRGAWKRWIKVDRRGADILKSAATGEVFRLRFADAQAESPARYWRTPFELGAAPSDRPLEGLTIALDPGHIGGEYARMEERWFQVGDAEPVVEGDMVLIVAEVLTPRLETLGARVVNIRPRPEPVTDVRPGDLRGEARQALEDRGVADYRETYERGKPGAMDTLQWQKELLFYRTSEIRARADKINEEVRPDLTLCIHFNAEAWGDAARPSFVEENHLHLLVNGCYSEAELAFADQRFEMLLKLLNRSGDEEIALAKTVADAMASETGLPPYVYRGDHAIMVDGHPYVYARNLLANRLFQSPVLYLEPYVMNNREVHERIQAGDYAGRRMVAGRERKSIYREYVDGLVAGLVEYYTRARAVDPSLD